MPKILIVEDDTSIQNLLKELLTLENYQTTHAYSGSEALLLLEKNQYDLILLDLMLPGLSGEELIKKVSNTPIIVLSAKISSTDKVKCLLSGASDYITKPFDNSEILARIKVQLRHSFTNHNLKHSSFELLNDFHTLVVHHKKINLTKTEYAIIKQLLLNYPNVLTKNKLLDLISFDTPDCDEQSLKVHISNIRKKLKTVSDINYIESVWVSVLN